MLSPLWIKRSLLYLVEKTVEEFGARATKLGKQLKHSVL